MKTQADVGAAVREARLLLKIGQDGLGPNQAHISRLENGTKAASLRTIEEIAQNMGIHPMTLLFRAYASTDSESLVLRNVLTAELKDLYEVEW